MLSDLTPLVKALEELNNSAGFALKYGPFFFAIALLVLTPFVALVVFKRFIGDTSAEHMHQHAYDDFRFYFRLTVVGGLLCVGAGVGWWLYENYRQVGQTQQLVAELTKQVGELQSAISDKKYAVVGVIMDGVKEYDEFIPTLSGQQTVVFTRMPETNNLFFVVLSDDQIPNTLDVLVMWGQYDEMTRTRTRIVPLPLQLSVAGKNVIGRYRFIFDQQVGKLKPI
jgi:hypothetical protein